MRWMVVALALAATPALGDDAQERGEAILDIEAQATEAALARKARTEARLAEEGVPVNANLPAIEDETQAAIRDHEAVVRRALALLGVAQYGATGDFEGATGLLDRFGLTPDDLTPAERAFIASDAPSEMERLQFSWRFEAAWALLWALGLHDELGKPVAPMDLDRLSVVVGEDVRSLVAKTELRPAAELLDAADAIYRYRWALQDARIGDRAPPAGLDPSVAVERHVALNWLIGYLGQDWDAVTPDT